MLNEAYDIDGDGEVTDNDITKSEKILRLENEDKKQDAQRRMTWFALWGMMTYPIIVVLSVWLGLNSGADALSAIANVYFVSVAAIVSTFFGAHAYISKNNNHKDE